MTIEASYQTVETVSGTLEAPTPIHLYYPDEGLGALYRRTMLNEYFANLIRRTNIHTVAEVPVDSHGIIGAGSLIFADLGCDVTLISDDREVLTRAQALMDFNNVQGIRYLHSPLDHISAEGNAFDLAWNFDGLLPVPDQAQLLREMSRIAKSAYVVVPFAYSYGQLMHYVYHSLTRTSCDVSGPRHWMHKQPIQHVLGEENMVMLDDGFIDVPWWPSFPELPNMVRGLLGRAPVQVPEGGIPEANPNYVTPEDLPEMKDKVERSAFVERGKWPGLVRRFFAHNLYVFGCKPEYRHALGL